MTTPLPEEAFPDELRLPRRVLLGPGPSEVHPRVLRAMATPLVGHLDPAFVAVMDDIKAMLRRLLATENPLTFAMSTPASAAMEACLVNLLEPGDEAVVCINGVFGGRMAAMVERCGARAVRVEAPWGEAIDAGQVADALERCDAKLVAIVHAETSTGVLQPLGEISRLTRDAGALFVVDAVTSFCGCELEVDAWGIDALYSGTQKCLSAPPGLAPLTFGPRALEALERRSTPVQSWFLDLDLVRGYWQGEQRTYHHTAPVSSCLALREALRLVLEEGLEARIARHRSLHLRLAAGLEELGFELLVAPEHRLSVLNAVKLPPGLDDLGGRQRLLDDYGIEVGGGLGELAGKVWRIGLMGESATINNVHLLLAALATL